MLFGTRERMTDVRCPAINVIRNREKWTTSGTYLNGGGFARGSAYSHATYTIGWNLMSPDEARKILDYYYGNYGDGPIYFLDDFALQGNVLPLHWSVPRLTAKDAPPLVKGVVVSETPLASVNNAGGYPSASATFAWTGTPNSDSVWVPVPPGQNFYFGARGSRTGTAEVELVADRTPPGVVSRTNLLTNPSFEATSGTVEVRRNLYLRPLMDSTTGMAAVNGATLTPIAGTGQVRIDAPAGGARDSGANLSASCPAVVAGDVITYSIDVTGEVEDRWRFSIQGSAGSAFPAGVLVPAGETRRVSVTVAFSGSGTPAVYLFRDTAATASTARISRPLVEKSPVVLQYFDGSFSPDSDLTPSWTGAANASASVLTGVAVVGSPSSLNTKIISSTQWAASGSRSMRVITSGTADSYARIAGVGGASGLVVGKTYTAIARLRQEATLTGVGNGNGSRQIVFIGTNFPGAPSRSVQGVNAAGEYEHRVTFTVPDTAYAEVRLYNGHPQGGGDVWWDNVLLVEGNYTGPYFYGDTPATSEGTYQWNGAANASTSTFTPTTVWGTGAPMPTTTTQRTNCVVRDPGGVTLSIRGSGSLTLNSMYGYIGTEPPPDGNFRSGEGHTGVVFDGVPQRTGYSAAIGEGLESVSSAFKEVGAWR